MAGHILASAHIISSDATRAKRASLIDALAGSLSKVTTTVEIVHNHALEPGTIPSMLSSWTAETPLVELDPKKVPDTAMSQLSSPLHVRSISNALNHYEVLLQIAKRHSGQGQGERCFSLVVEDDAVFSEEQMLSAVERAIRNAPEDADLIFLGLPSKRPMSSNSEFDDVQDLVATQVLPACDSYLVACSAAERIASGFLPLRFSTNIHLTFLIRSGVIRKAYIAVPNAFVDGSKLGVFPSSIATNNQLIWNQGYCQLLSMVTQGNVDGFEELWNKQSAMLQNHPDALVLLGDYHVLLGKAKEAEEVYDRALKMFEAEGCIVNNTSEFMKRYMSIYSDINASDQ
jgi:hypothetical protein